MKRILITVVLSNLLTAVFAQTDSLSARPATQDTVVAKKLAPPKSYFSTSISFLSNSVYNGRKDSVPTPYLTPIIGYYNKSGFFIDGSVSWLVKQGSSRIDLFNAEAGYDFDIGNFDAEVSANKSFYNSSSTNVKSQITGSVFASGGYDFTYIKPTFQAGVNFGNKSDYMLSLGLEHTFYQLKDKLQFTPGFLANSSTQNYYGSYYNKKKLGGKRKNAGVVYDVTASVADAAKLKIVDYEFSLPVLYVLKKLSFSIIPVFVIPVHPALITVQLKPESGSNTITRTSQEILSNSFYCSFGMTYKL